MEAKMFAFLLAISLGIPVDGHPNIPMKNGLYGYSESMDADAVQSLLAASEASPAKMKIFRLTDDVTPISYNLKMIPYLEEKFNFNGTVNISCVVNKPTRQILLHSRNLAIRSVKLFRSARELDASFKLLPADQMLNITTKRRLFARNTVVVSVNFTGFLSDSMTGFYRSSYRVGNTTKWLATTQFESTFARLAFPCFDEPRFRSTFTISIARNSEEEAISNMPLEKTSPPDPSIKNRVWDTFQTTPPMPTYLVAFIVSQFKNVTNSEKKVKIWARENAIQGTKYSLAQAADLLKIMENFIGIPYNLPKMDVVAVPDFQAGAMENWGLTTFRERFVLWDEKSCSEQNKERVTGVIAHEFAHQWFGDLVTIAWWDYLWLNEGFATYFEYHIPAIKEPKWRVDELFNVEVLHYALAVDGIFVHRAMTSQVHAPYEIRSKFDAISYDKAGSVIRMIEHILTPSTFKKSLNRYIGSRKDAGGVATPSDLYEVLEEVMRYENESLPHDLTITTVFKKFAEEMGYPCVKVSRQSEFGRTTITIRQETYVSPRASANVTKKTWPVPLSCTKQSQPNFVNTRPTMWLIDEKEIVLRDAVKSDEWYICNLQQTGYYRVNYDADNWNLLIKQLHSSHLKIHQLNRAQLIDDTYTFAIDDHLPFSVLFDLLRYLEHEVDPIPWYTGLYRCEGLVQRFEATKASSSLQNFAKHIVSHFYTYIGFYEKTADSHLVKILRPRVLFLGNNLGIKEVADKANAEYSSKSDLSEIPAYMKEMVLCTALRTNSSISVWNRLWDLYRKSNIHVEQETVLLSLGCATDESLLKRFLFKLIDDDDHDIRPQHVRYVFMSVHRFQTGVTASINFIHDILPQIGNFTKGHSFVINLLHQIESKVKSHAQIHRLEHVIQEAEKLNQQKYGDIKETLTKVKANAEKKMAVNDKIAEKISAALSPQKPTPIPPAPKPSAASYLIPNATTFVVILLLRQLCSLKLDKYLPTSLRV